MGVVDSLIIAAQSIGIALSSVILGLIFGKAVVFRGELRAEVGGLLTRLLTGSNQVAIVVRKLHGWAKVATTDGVLGLIGVPQSESHVMASKGLQMVLTGKDSGELRTALDEDAEESMLLVDRAVQKIKVLSGLILVSALLSTTVGLILCLLFADIETLRLLGLYTIIMSVCYALFLVTPVAIGLVRGLRGAPRARPLARRRR